MLPGSDNAEISSSAFNYLLMLAERVSVLTEVKITAQFDKDVEVDVSELKIVNDYFELKKATVDENNTLTLVCNWIDRTESIDPATANPVCILTGIKAKPAADAKWDENELIVINTGTVSFDIYLRASSLYSFANKAENQQKYGLYPYTTNETGWEGGEEKGAHFADSYAEFEDSFILNRTVRQGWYKLDGKDYYFDNHKAVTGIQYLPSKNDDSKTLFYKFDENGVCLGACTGVIEYNGDLYYAVNGEKTVGWLSTDDEDGNKVDYYFDRKTGKAVDGKQKIDGYNYTFTDYILTRGDLVKTASGIRYRWAGKWIQGQWFEVDGKWYCTKKYQYDVVTGFVNVFTQGSYDTWKWHLFDENGVFQSDYNGIYVYEDDTYYIKNGLRDSTVGLVYEGGYYYYISPSDAKAYKNTTLWVTHTNGLMPIAKHSFDEYGRMIDPPTTVEPEEPDGPDTPVNPPVNPEEPQDPVLNGIVKEENGNYGYYIDGKRQSGLGLVKLTDSEGINFYIYVRSNGNLAIGNYWITETNGLLDKKMYTFNEEGKYYVPPVIPDEPEKPEVKDGVINENGVLRYYINGVRQSGNGVVKLIDEAGITCYIYVRSNGQVATGVYWPTTRNDLLPRGGYNWGDNGRYYPAEVIPDSPEVKNGIYNENGENYYYIDGVRQANIGVVKLIDEEGKVFYIYVRSSGQLATGVYWPSNRNDLLPRGPYDWGTDGRYYPV